MRSSRLPSCEGGAAGAMGATAAMDSCRFSEWAGSGPRANCSTVEAPNAASIRRTAAPKRPRRRPRRRRRGISRLRRLADPSAAPPGPKSDRRFDAGFPAATDERRDESAIQADPERCRYDRRQDQDTELIRERDRIGAKPRLGDRRRAGWPRIDGEELEALDDDAERLRETDRDERDRKLGEPSTNRQRR